MKKAAIIVNLLIILIFGVPITQYFLKDATEAGGFLASVATPFELALWKFFAIIIGLIAFGFLIYHIGNKSGGSSE